MVRALLLLLLLTGPLCGQWLEEDWAGAWDLGFRSGHHHQGVLLSDEVMEPGCRLSKGPWRFAAWSSEPLHDGQLRERGATIGFHRATDDDWAWSLRATRKGWSSPRSGDPKGITELGISAEHRAGAGRVALDVQRDFARQATAVEVAFKGEWALKSLGAFIGYRVFGAHVVARDLLPRSAGPRVRDGFSFGGVDLALPYRVGAASIVTAGLHGVSSSGRGSRWSPLAGAKAGWVSASVVATIEF